jgi:FdhE protein
VAEYLRDEGFRKGEDAPSPVTQVLVHGSGGASDGLVDPLLAFVLNHALHPFLRKIAQTCASFVDYSIWYRPYCPICGGSPDFAALEKESGARRLLCSRCDFEWTFWRGICPFCGCDDPTQYKYSITADQVYRVYQCDRCRRYLKTLDLRQMTEERWLPVERILTLALDLAAQQAGYVGCSAARSTVAR